MHQPFAPTPAGDLKPKPLTVPVIRCPFCKGTGSGIYNILSPLAYCESCGGSGGRTVGGTPTPVVAPLAPDSATATTTTPGPNPRPIA